jgi:hypothetical protein
MAARRRSYWHASSRLVGAGFGGAYMASLPNDPEPSPTRVATGTLSPFARLAFTHELTHRFKSLGLGPVIKTPLEPPLKGLGRRPK